jgi:RNA polymerase sigma-70 factor (ECF subfamily)
MLGTTTASVKSALQRAHARLEEVAPVLDQYIAAFENADTAALERLLTEDAVIEATPLRTWFAGRETCMPFLRSRLLGSAGYWRQRAACRSGLHP